MRKLMNKIDRFCYMHPRFGIPNLMLIVVIGNAAVWLLTKMDTTGQIVSLLSGSAQGILHGQVWRLVTYVFVPTEASPIWLLVMLYFYYWIGSCLEREWGNGKFTIYYVSGMLLTAIYGVVLSAILGRDVVVSTTYLNLSMFFAFATLYPDMQVLLFFIIPIKVKYLAYVDAALFVLGIVTTSFPLNLLPVVAVLTAATGAATGAAVRQGATVLFSDLLIGAIDTLLVPIVYAYVAVCAAHAAVGNEGLKKLASVLKWVVTSLLTAVLLAFVGYLTASGAIAGSADAAAIKTAKMAISRAVPGVGGILADAAETVLVGAGVLRGTVGIVGMLGVLAICLIPFLQLAFHYLTYKLAAALIGTVSDKRLSDLLDSIGGAFGIVLGMTGACALMLLVSLASAVKAVTP